MIPISQELQNAFNSNTREIYTRITINFSDTTLDPSVSVSTIEDNPPEFNQQIINGNTLTPCKWCSMDGDDDMSGDFCMMPSIDNGANQVGLWSTDIVAIDGSTNVVYSIDSLPRDVSNIQIVGDTSRSEYPVDLVVDFFDNAVLKHTINISNNTSVFIDNPLIPTQTNITEIRVTITKWSKVSTCVKIASTLTSLNKTFNESDIKTFNTIEESEISNNNTIPTGNISYSRCNLSLINRDRIFDMNNSSSPLFNNIKQSSKLDIELGARTVNGVEFFKLFSGYTGSFNSNDDSLITTTIAYDRLKRLESTNMSPSSVILNNTSEQLFRKILNDAGVADEFLDIDGRLGENTYIQPVFFIEGSTHLSELKRLSESLSTSIYVENDIIKVDSIEAVLQKFEVQETYSQSDYSDKINKPLYDKIYNTVRVPYANREKGVQEDLYTTNTNEKDIVQPDTDTELTFYFNKKVTVEHILVLTPIAGVSIVNQDFYSDRAVVKFSNTNITETEIEVSIQGKNYNKLTVKFSELTNQESELEFGLSVFTYQENDLIQNVSVASTISSNILESYKQPFRDVSINLSNSGNPALSLTDKINVSDRYFELGYNIISKAVMYDGGINMLLKTKKALLKNFNLIDDLGNNLIDDLGNNLIALIPDRIVQDNLIDNLGNNLITNTNDNLVIGG